MTAAVVVALALGAALGSSAAQEPVEPPCPAGSARSGVECAVRCPEPMLPVVGGTFHMGARDGDPDERPVHEVTLTSFCIDATEVTVGEYRACVAAAACRPAQADDVEHTSRPRRPSRSEPERHPINGVSWEDARAFCAWRDRRLPTEAEWEYAARGTDGRAFPWGDEPPTGSHVSSELGCALPPCSAVTMPVGRHPRGASPFGAQDMAGGLWEWVADWYGPYDGSSQRDPRGPASGTHRVLRGGGGSRPEGLRAANRSRGPASSRSTFVGFRCARSVEPERTP